MRCARYVWTRAKGMHTQGSWLFAISPACSWRRRIADNWETLRVALFIVREIECGSSEPFPPRQIRRAIQMPRAIDKSSAENGGLDDDFKSNSRAMYRGMFAVLTLVRPMPCGVSQRRSDHDTLEAEAKRDECRLAESVAPTCPVLNRRKNEFWCTLGAL
jgi:hypothetical protein